MVDTYVRSTPTARPAAYDALTPREREILLLGDGPPPRHRASLHVSEQTVHSHRASHGEAGAARPRRAAPVLRPARHPEPVDAVSTRRRLATFWASVRPRTRRGALLATGVIVVAAAGMSVALLVGATMAWSPYLEFSLQRDADARSWAALDTTFASSSTCGRCHEAEAAKAVSRSHEGIGCQSCHGPLDAHVEAGDAADSATVEVAVPTDGVCVRCHAQADGRPATLRQIVPSAHYVSVCLQCHDPHTGVANPPPVVLHPLDNLPPCLTCHGPEVQARNQRHPSGSADDKPCLDCHAPGRGPGEWHETR
jgi:cytochrome c553